MLNGRYEYNMADEIRILYVDDEPALLENGKIFLERSGQFSVDTITSAPAALTLLNTKNYDAIIADYQMPDMDGIEFLKTIRSSGKSIPFILFTGRGREEVVILALNEGADFYLQKGGEPTSQFAELSNKIRYAVTHRKAEVALRESEERYRRIVETTDEGISQMDDTFETVYVNRRMAEMLDYTPEEMIGRNIASFMAAEDIPDNTARIKERRQGKSSRYERRFITKNGRTRWMQVSATPLMDPDGRFRGSFLMCSDITDRKTAEDEIARHHQELYAAYKQLKAREEEIRQNYDEQAKSQNLLRESEQRYRNVVEDQTEFICRFLPDGTHVFVNDAYCRYFGLKREEIIGQRFTPPIPVENQERMKRFFASLTLDHPIATIEHRIIKPDGTIRWQRWSDRAIFDPSGTVTEYQSVGRDITEEKTTRTALEKSETRFREQYQNNPLAIFTWRHHRDGDFVFIDCNRAAQALTGGRSNNYLGRTASELYATRPEILSELKRCVSEQTIISMDLVSEHFMPGRRIHITTAFVPPDLIMIHLDDITERREAEEALRNNQRMLAEAMDLANLVNWECDIRTGILTFDDRFSTFYGTNAEQKDINHMTAEAYIQELVHPEDRGILVEEDEKTRKTTDPRYLSKREYRIIRKDGEIRHIEMCVGITKDAEGHTIKTHGVNQDITERKRVEEALQRANKKLSLLSGITRHDINNQLLVLNGFAAILQSEIQNPAFNNYFSHITKASSQIAAMVGFTQEYEEIGAGAPVWQDLTTVVNTAGKRIIPGQINVKNDIPAGTKVFADPMLEKVFSNLLDNAVRHGQRVTEIRVSSHPLGEDLVVVWEDNGVGIAADKKELIFERGFGKNTGLGMFLVREILSLTDITITVTGEPGKGARFEIVVPKRQYRFTDEKLNPP
jgi:PAS domain S-box-containing protein